MNFDPIFGEDNEVIGYLDDMGNTWTVEEAADYFDMSGNYPYSPYGEQDESWFDSDALASIGWGTDEDYGLY